MVAQDGGYCGAPFKSVCGVTQGYPLFTTVFNVVVDAVLQHWVTVVAVTEWSVEPGASGTESFGQYVQQLVGFFYAGDGLLALTQAIRLHWAFDNLKELFEQMFLRNNVSNTVSMDCQPCHTLGVHSVEAYILLIMREGLSFQVRLLQRFHCPYCNADLTKGSLVAHR